LSSLPRKNQTEEISEDVTVSKWISSAVNHIKSYPLCTLCLVLCVARWE